MDGGAADLDLSAPPADCVALFTHARALVVAALDGWLSAGLPLPDLPPAPGSATLLER